VAEKGYTKGLFNDIIANNKPKANKAAGFVPNFAERVGIVTGDVIRGNEYKEVLKYLANTTKPISTILGPAGVGKTTRASQMGGQLLKSFAEINKFDKFILDRAGFDVPQKDEATAANIRKIFAKSNAAGSLDVLFGSRNTVSSLRDKRLKEGDKIIGERNNLKGGSGGVGSFTKGIRGFLGEYGNANVLRMRKSGEQYGLSKVNFASGYVPNFANALNESISREISAGAPRSGIYTKQYPELVNSSNPLGIGVFNKRDEGSTSADKRAMSNRGYARGYIPNFAEEGGTNISSTVTAIGAELASFVTLLAFQIPNIRSNYKEEIATRKAALVSVIQQETKERRNVLAQEINDRREAIKQLNSTQVAQRQQLEAEIKQRSAIGASEKASARGRIKKIETGGAETLGRGARNASRLQAGVGAAGTALAFAPIIAETIASSIDTTNKEGRVKSAAVTGVGTALSAAGTGALVGSALGPVGTALGAALGLSVGAVTAWTKAVNESRTNLPELQAAVKKTSEEQSRLGEVTQTVLPKLEQLQELRQGGNAGSREAVALEKEIRAIASNASPEAQRAISAGGLDFAKTQKNLADVLQKLNDKLGRESATAQSASIIEQAIGGKITKEQFGEQISKQAVSGKTDAELEAMVQEVSGAGVSLSRLQDILGITEEQAGGLAKQFGRSWQEYAQALAQVVMEERKIRLDGARGTAKSFADQNGAAIKALKDFEKGLRKAISNMDIGTKIDIATSDAAFGSEFKRAKSTGQVDILKALGFEKAASNLETKNIYQDTIGKQKTESSAEIDRVIKQSLNKAFLDAIPTAATDPNKPESGIKDVNQYNDVRSKLGDLAGITGNQDFSQKIQDISAKIASIPKKTTEGGALGPYEQFDTGAIISELKDNGVKGEDLEKIRERIDNANKLIPKAQQLAAIKTVERIDELIKVTITGLSSLGGSLDSMINDGGMGDGSAAEKFTEAVDEYTATMKDPKATPEQRLQAARNVEKTKQNLGLDVRTDDPAYEVAQKATQEIAQNQATSISKNLARLNENSEQYNEKAMELGGGSIRMGLKKSAEVKLSTDLKPVNDGGSQKIIADAEQTVLSNLEKSGPEGKALADNYKKALEAQKKAPDGTADLGTIFKTQVGTSNGYLKDMVGILSNKASLPASIGVNEENRKQAFFEDFRSGGGFNAMLAQQNREQSLPGTVMKGEDGKWVVKKDKLEDKPIWNPYEAQQMMRSDQAIASDQMREKNRTQSIYQDQVSTPLAFNSPITIAINASTQAQGEQIQQQLQGIEQDFIALLSENLSRVEFIAAAAPSKDPSLNPPPRKPSGGRTSAPAPAGTY
jgi:hypothetical protein